jgi:two-component system heavy metal sensor histidine kinase CusS
MEEYHRLSQLVENILFLAKAENPKMTINRVELQAEEELSKICEFFNIIATEKQVTIRCIGTSNLYAEPILFRRAINNLLANAIRHTPSGGLIQLRIRPEIEGTVIVVSDNGPGIPEAYLSHVFDRFYRVNVNHSLNYSGAGLGLPIVKSIMELHQGRVILTSQQGIGTTVKLCFPNK